MTELLFARVRARISQLLEHKFFLNVWKELWPPRSFCSLANSLHNLYLNTLGWSFFLLSLFFFFFSGFSPKGIVTFWNKDMDFQAILSCSDLFPREWDNYCFTTVYDCFGDPRFIHSIDVSLPVIFSSTIGSTLCSASLSPFLLWSPLMYPSLYATS